MPINRLGSMSTKDKYGMWEWGGGAMDQNGLAGEFLRVETFVFNQPGS